ncbi:MAG TPA: TetR family transcriptional regulator [Caulobacteraceae bacterium]|jgi:AcrR family transcriptional regulator|nr:TetR family transcriptional regulator [Caulobacteraceae bacterium]
MSAVGNTRPEGAAGATVDELLNVAERLFAERGIENVALTQIVAASGQRNRSALHYHFGSRGGVLTTVLNRRLGPINNRREEMLDALPAGAAALDIVRATIAPLGLVDVEEAWGADYLSILAQVTYHPRLLGEQAVEDEKLTGLRRTRRLLAAAVPGLPDALLALRLKWLTDSVVFAMARWVRDTPAVSRTRAATGALIEQLAAYGTAGLTAPDPAIPSTDEGPTP